MLGFVCFIPLLDGPVVSPTVVSTAQPTPALPCHREHGNADAKEGTHHGRLDLAKASLKSDALSGLLELPTRLG
jgi:hypothetical protein